MARIPFSKPFIVGKELFYIAQAVLSGSIAGDGGFTRRCQEWLEQRLHTPKALLTHSCTAALEMAAILCDIQPGDEVIMPSFTFVTTANAFVLRGGVPVFVDIRADTLNIDERLIEAAVTERTRAIVAVHYAGSPCNMDAIMDIARRHDLMVIEDAAQAILSKYGDRYLGTIGHLGCLSFHETKNVISGEGGALLINDPGLIERAEIIWQKGTNRKAFFRGQVDKYTWVDIGSSFLPNELTAAFLFAQLERAERINEHRMRLVARYREALEPLHQAGILRCAEHCGAGGGNAHLFYVICKSMPERIALIHYLNERGINAVFHYVPLHDSPAGLRFARAGGSLAVTEDISTRLLRLPLYYEMNEADVTTVTAAVTQFYQG